MKVRSQVAFGSYRQKYGPAREPRNDLITHPDDCKQITPENGLKEICDGSGVDGGEILTEPSQKYSININNKHLWVVRSEDVVYALECCAFSEKLDKKKLKHTNLTGGEKAFAGGEMIFLAKDTLLLNAGSGRYPVRTEAEQRDLGLAFVGSGYHVWCMGFDVEANRPYPLGSVNPIYLR